MTPHYILLQFPIPGPHEELYMALGDYLENFVDSITLLGSGLHSIADVHAAYAADTNEHKVIAIKVNPFKRVLMLWQYVVVGGTPYGLGNVDYSSYTDFNDFVAFYFSDKVPAIEGARINMSSFYFTDTLKPDYLLDFDTFPEDMGTIPEFAMDQATDFFHQQYIDTLNYGTFYNETSRLTVEQAYAADISKFGYKFEQQA